MSSLPGGSWSCGAGAAPGEPWSPKDAATVGTLHQNREGVKTPSHPPKLLLGLPLADPNQKSLQGGLGAAVCRVSLPTPCTVEEGGNRSWGNRMASEGIMIWAWSPGPAFPGAWALPGSPGGMSNSESFPKGILCAGGCWAPQPERGNPTPGRDRYGTGV